VTAQTPQPTIYFHSNGIRSAAWAATKFLRKRTYITEQERSDYTQESSCFVDWVFTLCVQSLRFCSVVADLARNTRK